MKAKYVNPFTDFGFKKIFGEEASKISIEERYEYEESLKIYRDLKNTIDTAFEDGILEGKLETARALKSKGMNIDFIIEVTGLSQNEIEKHF